MQSRLGTTIGAVAQVVEQWTENPCVAGSTPASTTLGPLFFSGLFCFYFWDTAVSRTEDAAGAAGGCPQSVESAVLRAFEDASRTPGACFLHRMPPKMRRVPQEAFLSTARMFRTIGGPLRYRMPDTEAGCRRSEAWRTKKEADHNMFLALFDLLVAVDPTVGANMARGLWAAYAAGSLSSTYA